MSNNAKYRSLAAQSGAFNFSIMADPDAMDKLIDWKLHSPAVERANGIVAAAARQEWDGQRPFKPFGEKRGEGYMPQRQFTIELRVDFEDAEGKNAAMQAAIQSAARHVLATACMLADKVKPQIAIFSDDMFHGNEKIELLPDTIAAGKAALVTAGGNETAAAEETISPELLAAMK